MSIFPTKVLFATDGSRDAELAATTAVGLANTTGSELHLIHVGPVVPEHYEPTDVEPVRIHREATKILQVQSSKIQILHGKLAGSHLRMGGAVEEILEFARQIGAGLIVVGSRGLSGMRRALVGSVSDSVVRHVHCPVLVVRPEEGGA